jgi:hypothetical protein
MRLSIVVNSSITIPIRKFTYCYDADSADLLKCNGPLTLSARITSEIQQQIAALSICFFISRRQGLGPGAQALLAIYDFEPKMNHELRRSRQSPE